MSDSEQPTVDTEEVKTTETFEIDGTNTPVLTKEKKEELKKEREKNAEDFSGNVSKYISNLYTKANQRAKDINESETDSKTGRSKLNFGGLRALDVIIVTGKHHQRYKLCSKDVLVSFSAFFKSSFDVIQRADRGVLKSTKKLKKGADLTDLPVPMKHAQFHEYIFEVPEQISHALFQLLDWMHVGCLTTPASELAGPSEKFNQKKGKNLLRCAKVFRMGHVIKFVSKILVKTGLNYYDTNKKGEKTYTVPDSDESVKDLVEFGGDDFFEECEALRKQVKLINHVGEYSGVYLNLVKERPKMIAKQIKAAENKAANSKRMHDRAQQQLEMNDTRQKKRKIDEMQAQAQNFVQPQIMPPMPFNPNMAQMPQQLPPMQRNNFEPMFAPTTQSPYQPPQQNYQQPQPPIQQPQNTPSQPPQNWQSQSPQIKMESKSYNDFNENTSMRNQSNATIRSDNQPNNNSWNQATPAKLQNNGYPPNMPWNQQNPQQNAQSWGQNQQNQPQNQAQNQNVNAKPNNSNSWGENMGNNQGQQHQGQQQQAQNANSQEWGWGQKMAQNQGQRNQGQQAQTSNNQNWGWGNNTQQSGNVQPGQVSQPGTNQRGQQGHLPPVSDNGYYGNATQTQQWNNGQDWRANATR